MDVFKVILDGAYNCFQWRVPFIGCTMWQAEIALAVVGIVAYAVREIFTD